MNPVCMCSHQGTAETGDAGLSNMYSSLRFLSLPCLSVLCAFARFCSLLRFVRSPCSSQDEGRSYLERCPFWTLCRCVQLALEHTNLHKGQQVQEKADVDHLDGLGNLQGADYVQCRQLCSRSGMQSITLRVRIQH